MILSAVGRAGELQLRFAQQQQQTRLIENYFRPPLQVMQAIPDQAGCLCVYLLSPSGGVVQGDVYTITIRSGEHTHALLTTPSATRIYRMPNGSATQQIDLTLAEGAIFEFVPDANILFAESDFTQTLDVTLERGALVILQDLVMPGRLARGECFQFRRYRSRLRVRDAQGWLLYDAAQVEPANTAIQQMGVLDGFSCWGNLFMVGDWAYWGLDEAAFCQQMAERLTNTDYQAGISLLPRGGVGVRAISPQLEPMTTLFTEIRLALRSALGLSAAKLRK